MVQVECQTQVCSKCPDTKVKEACEYMWAVLAVQCNRWAKDMAANQGKNLTTDAKLGLLKKGVGPNLVSPTGCGSLRAAKSMQAKTNYINW